MWLPRPIIPVMYLIMTSWSLHHVDEDDDVIVVIMISNFNNVPTIQSFRNFRFENLEIFYYCFQVYSRLDHWKQSNFKEFNYIKYFGFYYILLKTDCWNVKIHDFSSGMLRKGTTVSLVSPHNLLVTCLIDFTTNNPWMVSMEIYFKNNVAIRCVNYNENKSF